MEKFILQWKGRLDFRDFILFEWGGLQSKIIDVCNVESRLDSCKIRSRFGKIHPEQPSGV